jgi:hypothetical protein
VPEAGALTCLAVRQHGQSSLGNPQPGGKRDDGSWNCLTLRRQPRSWYKVGRLLSSPLSKRQEP